MRIPGTWAGAQFYFEKVADRAAWDFALRQRGGGAADWTATTIRDARMVCGAVACVPHRLTAVERAIIGSAAQRGDRQTGGGHWPPTGAQPLKFNQFKIPLMENLVRRAIRGA